MERQEGNHSRTKGKKIKEEKPIAKEANNRQDILNKISPRSEVHDVKPYHSEGSQTSWELTAGKTCQQPLAGNNGQAGSACTSHSKLYACVASPPVVPPVIVRGGS